MGVGDLPRDQAVGKRGEASRFKNSNLPGEIPLYERIVILVQQMPMRVRMVRKRKRREGGREGRGGSDR